MKIYAVHHETDDCSNNLWILGWYTTLEAANEHVAYEYGISLMVNEQGNEFYNVSDYVPLETAKDGSKYFEYEDHGVTPHRIRVCTLEAYDHFERPKES